MSLNRGWLVEKYRLYWDSGVCSGEVGFSLCLLGWEIFLILKTVTSDKNISSDLWLGT